MAPGFHGWLLHAQSQVDRREEKRREKRRRSDTRVYTHCGVQLAWEPDTEHVLDRVYRVTDLCTSQCPCPFPRAPSLVDPPSSTNQATLCLFLNATLHRMSSSRHQMIFETSDFWFPFRANITLLIVNVFFRMAYFLRWLSPSYIVNGIIDKKNKCQLEYWD